jgi:hypothetical protein
LFVLITIISFLVPAPASALPSPLDLIPNGVPSLDPSHYIVEGFKSLLTFIFGDPKEMGKHLVNMLLAVPILTDEKAFPGLHDYRVYVTGGAWGILSLSFVIAALRYWLSSYSGSGSYEALQGFIRTTTAIVILLAFPIAFDQISRFVNVFTAWLVTNPIVGHNLSHGLVGTLSDAPLVGGGITMIVSIIAIIMAIILLIVKVIVTTLLAVLFVLSPLAIALYPIEEMAWGLKSLVQAMGALLMFPILWAVSFATFAVMSADSLFPGSQGDTIDAFLSPMITLAALLIAFKLPFAVLQQAMTSGVTPKASHGMMIIRNVQSGVSRGPRPKSSRR